MIRVDFVPIAEDQAQRLLRPAEIYSGDLSAADLVAGSACFAVAVNGRQVGAYALRLVEGENGATVWIMAAAGSAPGVNLVAATLPAIEANAARNGATALAVTTQRRGLIRKMRLLGYEVDSVNLRKVLNAGAMQ